MDTQPINQLDADEIVRILLTEHPDKADSLGVRPLIELAMAEGIPMEQAIDTVWKYALGKRCVVHNAVRCSRCYDHLDIGARNR